MSINTFQESPAKKKMLVELNSVLSYVVDFHVVELHFDVSSCPIRNQ